MDHQPFRAEEVFIVDDDAAICEILAASFSLEGYRTASFTDGHAFLLATQLRMPSFVLLDINMPGASGLDILDALHGEHYPAPVFIMSGYGDIPTAVAAIRKGALDFIEKPFAAEAIPAHIRKALAARARASSHALNTLPRHFPGAELLTPRERDVLAQITAAASNKEAGRQLGISPRTVEVHRARIMEKLNAKNAAHLVRIVLAEPSDQAAARPLPGP
jgi:FixJ family two-component response regulator